MPTVRRWGRAAASPRSRIPKRSTPRCASRPAPLLRPFGNEERSARVDYAGRGRRARDGTKRPRVQHDEQDPENTYDIHRIQAKWLPRWEESKLFEVAGV